MDNVKFDENVKMDDGGPCLVTKKPRMLISRLTDEEKLRRAIDMAQARRDYIKEYYKQNESYRTACKERSRIFSRDYYHTNTDYKQKVKERAKAVSKAKYIKKSSTKEDTKDEIEH